MGYGSIGIESDSRSNGFHDPSSNPVRSTRRKIWVLPSQKCCTDSLSVCTTPMCIRTHDHVLSPEFQHFRDSRSTACSLWRWRSDIVTNRSGLPIPLFIYFVAKLIASVKMIACGGSPPESVRECFYVHVSNWTLLTFGSWRSWFRVNKCIHMVCYLILWFFNPQKRARSFLSFFLGGLGWRRKKTPG